MYNIPGLNGTLQLTSYTACLLLTGQITNWDDPALKQNGANANVTSAESSGAAHHRKRSGRDELRARGVLHRRATGCLGAIRQEHGAEGARRRAVCRSSPTTPGSNWQAPGNGYDEQSTSAVASNVVNNAGAIGPVQVNYANDSGFTGSDPLRASPQCRTPAASSPCRRR